MTTRRREPVSVLSMGARLVSLAGVRRTGAGRRLIARLNVLGERAGRWLYLRRNVPFTIDGHKVFLSGRHAPSLGFVTDMIHGRYEPEMKTLLHGLIRTGMIVFDVGAHVGHYTLMAARYVGPRGHVYAFEPDAENYAILKKNVELNGYTNVTCVPRAISNRTGVISLYVSRQGNDRHTVIDDPRAAALSIKQEVRTITLDEFAESVGWPRVDVIKMDVEGAEPLAVAGMSELFRRSDALSLVVEFAPEILRAGGAEPEAFLNTLRGVGFAVIPVEADMSKDAFQPANLPNSMLEVERRGAINLLCQRHARDPAAAAHS